MFYKLTPYYYKRDKENSLLLIPPLFFLMNLVFRFLLSTLFW